MIVSIAVLLFLNIFTANADKTMTFIDFDSYAIQNEDHTLTTISMDEFYTITPTND